MSTCRYWNYCPHQCPSKKPRVDVIAISKNISFASYYCSRYRFVLKIFKHKRGFQKFFSPDKKMHQCIRVKNGQTKLCPYFVATQFFAPVQSQPVIAKR